MADRLTFSDRLRCCFRDGIDPERMFEKPTDFLTLLLASPHAVVFTRSGAAKLAVELARQQGAPIKDDDEVQGAFERILKNVCIQKGIKAVPLRGYNVKASVRAAIRISADDGGDDRATAEKLWAGYIKLSSTNRSHLYGADEDLRDLRRSTRSETVAREIGRGLITFELLADRSVTEFETVRSRIAEVEAEPATVRSTYIKGGERFGIVSGYVPNSNYFPDNSQGERPDAEDLAGWVRFVEAVRGQAVAGRFTAQVIVPTPC